MIVHLGYDNDEMKKITSNRIAFGSKWRNLDYNVIYSAYRTFILSINYTLKLFKQKFIYKNV